MASDTHVMGFSDTQFRSPVYIHINISVTTIIGGGKLMVFCSGGVVPPGMAQVA